jgi:heavy metal sensor kinase
VTLNTRLNLFFLTALAIVLIGFSVALYCLARLQLHRQVEDRLESAVGVLAAAVEVTPGGVEWEPTERHLSIGHTYPADTVVWLVSDPDGHLLDQAGPPDAAEFSRATADHLRASLRTEKKIHWQGDRWQFHQLWIEAPIAGAVAKDHAADEERKYPALGITVGMSLEPLRRTLREIAAVLAGVSLGIWVVALLLGRLLCRRALRPVTSMAKAAREIDAAVLDRRLPMLASEDELEALGRAFNGLLDRVQEAYERQKRFSGEASHQLRTPLTALLGQVEVALRRDRPPEEYRRVLASVLTQADRMRRIVDALLFLARADAESQLPEREPVELSRWLPGLLEECKDNGRFEDLVTRLTPVTVKAHAVLLGELVNVLLDNAFKYSTPGTPVAIEVQRKGVTAELTVTDQGTGIRPEDLEHLFEPFFRSPDSRRRGLEGFGLGLAVARRIADALGGTLTVSSVPGEGSCFTLRLPCA